jgi:RND family efflux transporter MFP subunit
MTTKLSSLPPDSLPKTQEGCDSIGIHIEESRRNSMRDLKEELASLRIERERPPRRWGRIIGWLVVVAVVAGVVVYYLSAKPSLGALGTLGATEVEVTQASVQNTGGPAAGTPILTASGYLVARKQSVISSKIQGRLSELRVEEGSVVRGGEVIARLEDADYVAGIAKAKADIEYAKANLAEVERQARLQQGLYQGKVVSQDAVDAADAKVRIAKATVAQDEASLQMQQSLLEFTEIRAPFDGVVIKKMTEVGESVAPIPPGVNVSTSSGAIVAIADMNSLEAEVDVNEANVAQLTSGQLATIAVQAIPNHPYDGRLRQIIPTADRTKATVTVKVSIVNKDKNLKPEMSCNVTFLEPPKKEAQPNTPAQRIVTISKDAITDRDGKSVVFQVENRKVHVVPVITGNDLNGQVIVKNGLVGSETLVLSPPQKLQEGDTVKVKG